MTNKEKFKHCNNIKNCFICNKKKEDYCNMDVSSFQVSRELATMIYSKSNFEKYKIKLKLKLWRFWSEYK